MTIVLPISLMFDRHTFLKSALLLKAIFTRQPGNERNLILKPLNIYDDIKSYT